MNTQSKHQVYLAVPGKRFCFGTTTGVINSTIKHVAHPFGGGMGFNCVVDFNILWTHAQNFYEAGEITHFAMLHGDITPDPAQRWLDILLDEMDARDAELVSAVLPIKDDRGVTSSGIGEAANPWGAYRRFTDREIHQQLPVVFNNVLAGYPDKPLLHNTGCWVCDLRKPVFRETNEDGSLRLFFQFPERISRTADGKWQHEQESEDWFFSRQLWERGARNTWMTSEVRLTHHGQLDYPNWVDFGRYREGDEDTANRWRKDRDALPLALTQILEFELGSGCNLAGEHTLCPNRDPCRYLGLDTSQKLDDDTIVNCAVRAYRELGFTGLVGWIYYNEPLLQADRMFRLMDRIKAQMPAARFILWTNGTLIPEDCEQYRAFEQIFISGYNAESCRGRDRLVAKKINLQWIDAPCLDNRLEDIAPADPDAPCLRPHVEFIIDNYGNTHLCCYDWQGRATVGNVFAEDFAVIARRWRDQLPSIAGPRMTSCAPDACRHCGHRWIDKYQGHDQQILERVRRYRVKLMEALS